MRGHEGWVALVALLGGCDAAFDLVHVDPLPAADAVVVDTSGDSAKPTGLVAHYTMDSINSSQLMDAVNGNHGTCVSCPTPTAGMRAGALVFDGASNAIDVAAAPALQTAAFTVAVWLRLETVPGTSLCAVSKPFGAADENSWQICAEPGFVLSVYMYDGAGKFLTATALNEDAWHHAAITWDGTTVKLFVDGSSGASTTATLMFDSGHGLVIGADRDSGGLVAFWDGSIDDLRIYDRVLLDAELASLATP